MSIAVCIVDDNKDIRSALEQIIQMSENCLLIGSFATPEEALKNIPVLKPNVVLMDIDLNDVFNGIQCVQQLKPENPEVLFMMCTVYEDDEKIYQALTAGASGYILKKTAPGKWPARYSACGSRFSSGKYQEPSITTRSGLVRFSASQSVVTKCACSAFRKGILSLDLCLCC